MKRQQILDMANAAQLCGCIWIDEDDDVVNSIELFGKIVAKAKAEEIATDLLKGPVNDTAASIAIWIRDQA